MNSKRIPRSFSAPAALACVAAFILFTTWFGIPLRAQAPAGPNRPAGVPEGFVITPFGYFHPSCVLHLAEGDKALTDESAIQHLNGLRENIAACDYPHYTSRGKIADARAASVRPPEDDGWIESASVATNSSYGKLVATWTVPPAPISNDGQIVYFFPGMEDDDDVVTIIQPVLGWNMDGTGGAAWSIASWNCCYSGNIWESTPVGVNSTDTIVGTIASTCGAGTLSCSEWNITTYDETSGKGTTLSNSPSDGQTFDWAQSGVLEVHHVAQCSDYPPSGKLTFYNVALEDNNFQLISNPGWSADFWAGDETPQCNFGVQTTATTATLFFGVPETLTVQVEGYASGPSVTSSPAGINAGSDGYFSANFTQGTVVTLTATHGSGDTFAGWGGACSGNQATCTVTMNAAKSVNATFF
ncbi:MAG: hypothetical protein ABSC48_13350 [Terracidiphilus sp.]